MKNNNQCKSLRAAFAGALMLGVGAMSAHAQVYDMRGSGGGAEGSYSSLSLPYPNGEVRRILYPYDVNYGAGVSDKEKQHVRERITPILRDYVTNVMPQMPAIYEQDFAFVISILSYSVGVDKMTLCQDVGYDCRFVEDRQSSIAPNLFANLYNRLNTPYRSSGYDIRPTALGLDEGDIDEINGFLDRLRVDYPHDQRYQIPDYTYDYLDDIRKDLAEQLAYTMLIFGSDLVSGALNPERLDNDIQDYLSMISRVLSEPEMINMRNGKDTAAYNKKMPEYIDAVLENKYALSEANRNELYAMIFRARDHYDYRVLPHEDDFIAERDVIGAPQP